MKTLQSLTLIAVVVIICGCSGGGSPVAPTMHDDSASAATPVENTRHLWGVWEVRIDADRQSVEVTPVRAGEMHLNVLFFLERTCSDCLWIGNVKIYSATDFSCIHFLEYLCP